MKFLREIRGVQIGKLASSPFVELQISWRTVGFPIALSGEALISLSILSCQWTPLRRGQASSRCIALMVYLAEIVRYSC